MTAPNILVVDDDPQIRDVIRIALEKAGMTVETARDGAEGLRRAQLCGLDLIVLDVGMPRMDGLAMCQAMRPDDATPILFLSARDEEVDRILGLEMGGDDYVTKPFSPRELVARIKAILKRIDGSAPAQASLRRGILELDEAGHLCRVGGDVVPLTRREMAVLARLMRRPEQVFSRPALVDAVYGPGVGVSDRTLDSHLRNLRAKLSEAGCSDAIETVHGVGLRMGDCAG